MFAAFVIGMIVGANFGVLVMAMMQINRAQKERDAEASPRIRIVDRG